MKSKRSKTEHALMLLLTMMSLGAGAGCSSRAAPVPPSITANAGTGSNPQSCPNPLGVPPQVDPVSGKTCHPSACTPSFCTRGDIAPLGGNAATQPLQDRLVTLDCSPHSVMPVQVFAEATPPAGNSQLFMYYLLDSTGFQPSVLTTAIPGVNDKAMRTSWGANCNLPTIGSVRIALEPKPGLPTDPDDVRAFIDVFTDIRGLFVINNESGWYEGWMIHDLRVADVAAPDAKGHPKFGTITAQDAAALASMGSGNNVPGHFFTVDGKAPRVPSPSDHFPDRVANVVSLYLSMGAYNALQQADAHAYWEFNYTTNWIHPLYELPFTGGFPSKDATDPATAFQDGQISARQSIVPGDEPGDNNRNQKLAVAFGDNPDRPRDPDLFDADDDSQREFRERFIPSGVAREVFLNAFERLASFEPNEHNLTQRLLKGYKAAIAVVDTNGDGIVSAEEGDVDTPNPNCPQGDNTCIFLTPRSFNRFAVTREINDGLLAPRFAPSTRGWVLAGSIVTGFPAIPSSEGEDADDR